MGGSMNKMFAAAIAVALPFAGAQAADTGNGKTIFVQHCALCHKVTAGGGNGLGPNLFGVVGRKAGTLDGFAYSPAMKAAGFAWSDDKLIAYIEHPATVVPGNRMPFTGLGEATQSADVAAYLATLK